MKQMSSLAARRKQKQIDKLIRRRLTAIPEGTMIGTSLDKWITKQVEADGRFGDVKQVTIKHLQGGGMTASITLKEGD